MSGLFDHATVQMSGWLQSEHSLHICIAAVTAACPDAVALITPEGHNVTYAALDKRKRQYVYLLDDQAVGPGDCIGLNGNATVDHIAAMLAIMHRGAVAVPLAADLPVAYMTLLLGRAGASLVLSDNDELRQAMPWLAQDVPSVPKTNSPEPVGPDSPFLLMFTSGSTGQPKGVLHSHRQPVNRLRWMYEAFDMSDTDVCVARPSISIMPSIWEIFGGLCAGRPTLLLSTGVTRDPAKWVQTLVDHKATLMTLTPALMRVLLPALDLMPADARPDLRLITVGGEKLPDQLVRQHHRIFCGCQLLEDYGATEVNTVGFGLREANGEPIYRPISGVKVAVVGKNGTALTVGQEGELCVAGRGLALCYWGNTALTEDRFGPVAGLARAYRTGDRAKILADGRFHLLGRTQDLVKLNGLTVDLVAIECALREITGVTAAAAFTSQSKNSDWAQLCAAVVGDTDIGPNAMRALLTDQLPPNMVPSRILYVAQLPQLTSGKLDRDALPDLLKAKIATPSIVVAKHDIQTGLRAAFAEVVGEPFTSTQGKLNWDALGLNSLSSVVFAQTIETRLGVQCTVTDLFDHATPERLTDYLETITSTKALTRPNDDAPTTTVTKQVITGMSVYVPGAQDLTAFWNMIRDGQVAQPRVPTDRWPDADAQDPVLRGAFVQDAMGLNAQLHGLSPTELRHADPQQRLVLRAVRQCLQDAGLSAAAVAGRRVGIFLGLRPSGFAAQQTDQTAARSPEAFLGGDDAMVAARIAHELDLHGPAMAINTTCSSGLVGLHQARTALASGECDMAIVAGVSVICDPEFLRKTVGLGVTSITGACRPFDASADGFVPSEGVGCVLVEPLTQAQSAGRTAYARVVGSGLNHDGLSKSVTAPNSTAQSDLLSQIYAQIPDGLAQVGYLETHGTGTALGDPVECAALARVWKGANVDVIPIGSLKANIGHANAAAGIVSLIKAALCLYHQAIPPLAGFDQPNDKLSGPVLDQFEMPKTARVWLKDKSLIGVSAFGMSGTNAHVVLGRESSQIPMPSETIETVSFPVSAPTLAGLQRHATRLSGWLRAADPAPSLLRVAATMNARTLDQHHGWVTATSFQDGLTALDDIAEGRISATKTGAKGTTTKAALLHLPVSEETDAVMADQRMIGSSAIVPQTGPNTPDLTAICAAFLGDQDWVFHADTLFRDLGLDSIKVLGLRDALRDNHNCELSEFELLETMSLRGLERIIPDQSQPKEQSLPTQIALPEIISDTGPLTDLQSVFLTAKLTGRTSFDRLGAWNYLVLDMPERVDFPRFETAWKAVRARHGMLRIKILANGQQQIAPDTGADIVLHNSDRSNHEQIFSTMIAAASIGTKAQMAQLQILRGATSDQLILGVDSFVADARSTRIFLEDLLAIYAGDALPADLHPHAFLGLQAAQHTLQTEANQQAASVHWTARLSGHDPAILHQIWHLQTTEDGWKRLSKKMSQSDVDALTQAARAAGTSVLTCLMAWFTQWLGAQAGRPIYIGLTVAQRPVGVAGSDLIVGPFTEMMLHPIDPAHPQPAATLQASITKDLDHRALTGTAVLRTLALDPPRIVFSAVTQTAIRNEPPLVQGLSITSGVHLHVHATRHSDGGIVLDWDVDQAQISAFQAQVLFDDFCAALSHQQQISKSGVAPSGNATSDLSLQIAPLTRAMRSYQIAKLGQRQTKPTASYAARAYPIAVDQVPGIKARWSWLMAEHTALHCIQTIHGLTQVNAQVTATHIAQSEPRPKQRLSDWFDDVVAQEALELAAHQWPPMRLVTGNHQGQTYLICVFNCQTLDAPSTILAPQMLLRDGVDADPNACLAYANWQQKQMETPEAQGYWRNQLEPLEAWSNQALTLADPHAPTQLLRCNFPCPSDTDDMALAATLATAFQRSLSWFPAVAALPVMVVGYADRSHRPDWAGALGDFTTFGFLPPGCAEKGRVARTMAADRAHRGTDWFPMLADRVRPKAAIFPAVFTDALSAQSAFSEPGGGAVWTASHTVGPHIDCLAYSIQGDINVEWSVNTSVIDADDAQEAFEAFREEVTKNLAGQSLDNANTWQASQNQTRCFYDENATIVQLFDRAAIAFSTQTALVDDDGQWSYATLADQVRRYAEVLSGHYGIGKGSVVAVRMRRERRLPAMLLAILRLGAAFVPLNSGDPTERHNRMLKQAKAGLIVLSEPDAHLTGAHAVTIAQLDAQLASTTGQSTDVSEPTDLAYVIFTSGSTGGPKGVKVRHRPVINLIEDLQKRYGFGPKDRGLWVNAVGFDLTIFDFFGLLSQGASLRIVNETDRLDPLRIARLIGEEPITFWNSAPVYFHTVIGQLLSDRFQGSCDLRLAFFSGDWIPLNLARQCLTHLPNMQAVALGGATEAVVWSNLHEIRKVRDEWRSIPYGRPIQNAKYYITDDTLTPVGPGEHGDLFIGGACLSDGYINAPDLNAQAFVPDPFEDKAGAVMYRTGDLAQFLANGEIEFLGRADRQVKIRGHRIEVGEIEQAMEFAGYSTPVVVASQGGESNTLSRSLIGFCIGAAPIDGLDRMAAALPDYMLPARIVSLAEYPTTTNGKLDRDALLRLANPQRVDTVEVPPKQVQPVASTMLRSDILAFIAELLDCSQAELDLSLGLGHQGFNSLHYALLANNLSDHIGHDVLTSDILPLPSIDSLLDFAVDAQPTPAQPVVTPPQTRPPSSPSVVKAASQHGESSEDSDDAIAVVSLYCRMPGADDAPTFWDNIVAAKDCITHIPENRWDWQAVYGDATDRDESLSRWGGFLSHVDSFDHGRFNVSPREAAAMDPRQRMMLTGCWQLLEEAGYAPVTKTSRNTGVFLGVTGDEYSTLLTASGAPQDQLTLLGTGRSFIANRINYAMNWSGPSEVIDTTCSSSLVAIHHAVSALRNGDCEMAVAGGVSVLIDPSPHVSLSKVGVLAKDGRCKTFDARANGYVRSEGIGLVLLKPLSRALADGDQVRAVVRACRINHGGRSSAMTAPNVAAQASLIDATLNEAGPGVAGLGMHEAHGTGTRLGDPIEVSAYQQALSQQLNREDMHTPDVPVSMGALKSAIGHTEAAAGVAGFIKAVLALEHATIPPLAHFQTQNPEITANPDVLRFDVAARDWPCNVTESGAKIARRASVSAFGFGGVNAFAVLEEAPARPVPTAPIAGQCLLALSAIDANRLQDHAAHLADWLEGPGADEPLADIAYTLQRGRVQDKQRFAVVVGNHADAIANLRAPIPPMPAQNISDPDDLNQALSNGDLNHAAELWQQGAVADWSVFTPAHSVRRMALPLTIHTQDTHWHASLLRPVAAQRARWRDPRPVPGGDVFRVTARDGFLADHVIEGQALMPGAAWIAAASQAIGPRGLGQQFSLQDVTFRAPLVLGDAPNADVSAVCTDGVLRFATTSNPDTVLCSMRVADTIAAQGLADLQAHGRGYLNQYDSMACAQAFQKFGITYGPLYRLANTCWHSEDEALLYAQLPKTADTRDGLTVPMLDALFQAIVLFEAFGAEDAAPCVPFHIESVDLMCAPGAEAYIRVTRDANGHRHNARLYDANGQLCVCFNGVSGQPLIRSDPTDAGDVVGFTPEWTAVQENAGTRNGADGVRIWQLDIGAQSAPSAQDWVMSGAPDLSVVLNEKTGEATDILAQLAGHIQAICQAPGALDHMTRSLVWSLPAACDWAKPVAAGIAGLAETLRLEHPALQVKVIVSNDPHSQWMLQRLHKVPNGGLYRLNDGHLETCQLQPLDVETPVHTTDLLDGGAFDSTGFVVITGGAGAIGQKIARALSAKGAPVLALGRSATPPENLPESVHYQSVDVTDEKTMQAIITTWRDRMGPVRAVYHCAGLTPGGLFARRDPGLISAQLAIKLRAAQILDTVTALDGPRVFVSCSSLIAHSGVVGCADYAMANRAMEAFLTQRAKQRPGRSLSIAWSAWPDGGMAFTGPQAERIAAEGIAPIPADAALRWIGRVLARPDITIAVSPYGDASKIKTRFKVKTGATIQA